MVENRLNGDEDFYKLLEAPFNLIILDVMLPKHEGLSVPREIRLAIMNTPVVMLTASGRINAKIGGLDLSADNE